jgi:hypothetical protein
MYRTGNGNRWIRHARPFCANRGDSVEPQVKHTRSGLTRNSGQSVPGRNGKKRAVRRVLDDLKRSATCNEARVCPRYVAVSVDQFDVQRGGTLFAQLSGIPAVFAAALHLPAKEPVVPMCFVLV